MVWTCLCFYHLLLPLMTQLPEYLPYIMFQLMVYYFSPDILEQILYDTRTDNWNVMCVSIHFAQNLLLFW